MLAPDPVALRRAGVVGVVGAVVATVSDLTLLRIAGAGRPAALLLPATYAGALAILLYAVGWWQAACGLLPAGERPARRVVVLGAAFAGIGAVIHGMTGIVLQYETIRGGDVSPPTVIGLLLPLWLLGVACGCLLTVVWAHTILRRPTAYPRWMAAANPIVLPVLVAGLSLLAGRRISAFVVPAAPNIAQAVLFALTVAFGFRTPARAPGDPFADATAIRT
jgi:hypothetical protein